MNVYEDGILNALPTRTVGYSRDLFRVFGRFGTILLVVSPSENSICRKRDDRLPSGDFARLREFSYAFESYRTALTLSKKITFRKL